MSFTRRTLIAAGIAGALEGCFVVPVPRKAIHGPELGAKSLDLSFLRPGITRREEVVEKLSVIDTHAGSAGLFWGRWTSLVSVYWGAVGGGAPGAYAGAGGGEGKHWRRKNVLILFDEQGVVQKVLPSGDDGLLKVLDRVVPTHYQPEPERTHQLHLVTHGGTVNPTEELILGEQRVLFTGSASGKPRWECRFDQVTELLTFSHSDSGSEGSSHIALKLRTNIPQSVGTYVRKFELYPEDVLRLVDFLHSEGLDRILPK